MKHYYSEIDSVILTFSDIEERNEFNEITVQFERPNEKDGFDFAEGRLPGVIFYKSYGFSEEELFRMENYLKNNSALIWKIAAKEGAAVA